MKTRGKILLITRNPDFLEACRQALKAESFSVLTSDSIHQGIDKAKEEDIDIVLLDEEVFSGQRALDFLKKLWENDPYPVCLLLSRWGSEIPELQALQTVVCDRVAIPLLPEHRSLREIPALGRRVNALELRRCQLENLRKTVEWLMEKRLHSMELKRLQALEETVAPLWAVAKGEMETSDLFGKAFLGPAAFRLTLAHEFRAPLTALQSFLLILLKGYVAPEKWKEIVQHAYDRSQDLLALVDDLMNLAAAQQEMSPENCFQIRLGDELEKLVPSTRSEAEGQGLTFILTLQENPFVKVNPLHMGQLWSNLISNAIKYTPPGGTIRISLDQDEAWAIGTVEDSGIGISPQELPLIFHEFYRTADAKKLRVRGTGLGLPLVKRIVEGYGGSLDVQSTAGKGSSFRFTLPLMAASSTNGQQERQEPS